jgi:NAD(P)-dependent dehydrogenase (short-subunit alcohol dehydrogenase family)
MGEPKIIFITGTSRGLGATLLAQLRAQGHTVYGSSRQPRGDAGTLTLDVTSTSSCQEAIECVVREHGRVDVLINNAGGHLLGAAVETSEQELREQLELNFFGAVRMTQAALPKMIERRGGKIINISSVGGRLATPFTSAYAASKFALEGYMETNLEPSFIATGTATQSIYAVQSQAEPWAALRAAHHQHMLSQSGDGVRPERVAQAVSKIIEMSEPKLRYSVDGVLPRLMWLRALLPSARFEREVIKQTSPGLLEHSTK